MEKPPIWFPDTEPKQEAAGGQDPEQNLSREQELIQNAKKLQLELTEKENRLKEKAKEVFEDPYIKEIIARKK